MVPTTVPACGSGAEASCAYPLPVAAMKVMMKIAESSVNPRRSWPCFRVGGSAVTVADPVLTAPDIRRFHLSSRNGHGAVQGVVSRVQFLQRRSCWAEQRRAFDVLLHIQAIIGRSRYVGCFDDTSRPR